MVSSKDWQSRGEHWKHTLPTPIQWVNEPFSFHYREVKQIFFEWLYFDCQTLGLVSFCSFPVSEPFFAELSSAAHWTTDGPKYAAGQLLVQERSTTTGQQDANDILLEGSENGLHLPFSFLFYSLLKLSTPAAQQTAWLLRTQIKVYSCKVFRTELELQITPVRSI